MFNCAEWNCKKENKKISDQWTLAHLCPFNFPPAAPPAFSFSFRLLARHSTSISTKLIIVRMKQGSNFIMTEWIQKFILLKGGKMLELINQITITLSIARWWWINVNYVYCLLPEKFFSRFFQRSGFIE